MDIQPSGFIGHSVGELACAYADGCLTVQQAMQLAYYRGKALSKSQLTTGSMAAIGKISLHCVFHKYEADAIKLIPRECDFYETWCIIFTNHQQLSSKLIASLHTWLHYISERRVAEVSFIAINVW